MKHLKTLLSSACCLSICLAALSSFGVTGAEAAGGISSDPKTKGLEKRDTYDVQMQYYDKAEKVLSYATVNINDESTYEDLNHIIDGLQQNLSSAAYNALLALGKIAFLEGETEWLGLRINTLTETVKAAFESLDTIDIEDLSSKVTARLTKSSKTDGGAHYTGFNIFNVAGAQADGKSISSNSQDRLELNGFSKSSTDILQIPYKGSDKILWSDIGFWGDGKSIGKNNTGGQYNTSIQIAGWESPGTPPHGCSESIAAMLTRTESDPAPTPEQDPAKHLVLTRYSGGADPVIHFTQLGSLGAVGGGSAIHFFGTEGDAVVGSGSTTNNVVFDSFDDSNVEILVESDNNGNATITFGVYYQ